MSSFMVVPIEDRAGNVIDTVLISPADEWVLEYTWHRRGEYAAAVIDGERQYLHRVLLGLTSEDGWLVDHKDRNRWNCRRSNLRLATQVLNQQNRNGKRTNPYPRGVSPDKRRGTFQARVCIEGHTYNLGSFSTPDEAGEVASTFRAANMPWSPDAVAVA